MKFPVPPIFWDKARECDFTRVTDLSTRTSNPLVLPFMTRPTAIDTKLAYLNSMMKSQDSSKVLLFVRGDTKVVGCISFTNCMDERASVVGKLFDRFDHEGRFVFAMIQYIIMFSFYVTLVTQEEADALNLLVSEQDVVDMILKQGVDPGQFLLQYFEIDLSKHSVKFAFVNMFLDHPGGGYHAPDGLQLLDSWRIRAYADETGVAAYVPHWLNIQSRHTSLFVDGDKTHCLNQPNCNVGPVMFGEKIDNFFPRELDRSILATAGSTTVDVGIISEVFEGYDVIHNYFVSDLMNALEKAVASGATTAAVQGGAASFGTPVASRVRACHTNTTGTTTAPFASAMNPNVSSNTSPGIRGLLASPVQSLRGFGGTVADAISGRKRSPPSSAKTSPASNTSSPSRGSPMDTDSEYDSDVMMIFYASQQKIVDNATEAPKKANAKLRASQEATKKKKAALAEAKNDRAEARKQEKHAIHSVKAAKGRALVIGQERNEAALNHEKEMEELENTRKHKQALFDTHDLNQKASLEETESKVKKYQAEGSAANEKFKSAQKRIDALDREVESAEEDEKAASTAKDKIHQDAPKAIRIARKKLDRFATPKEIRLAVEYFVRDEWTEEFTYATQVVGNDDFFNGTRMDAIAGLLANLGYTPPPGFGFSSSSNDTSLLERQTKLAKLMGLI